MSKTKYVSYMNRGFWTYDVGLNVFLKHLIDAAEGSDQAATPWLSSAISSWRLSCVPDFGLTLDTDWSATQRQTFITLTEGACATLEKRVSISAAEIAAWRVLDDLQLYTRGDADVLTAPVVELGRAIIALVTGELPEPPDGKTWLYGTPEGRDTLDIWKGPRSEPQPRRTFWERLFGKSKS